MAILHKHKMAARDSMLGSDVSTSSIFIHSFYFRYKLVEAEPQTKFHKSLIEKFRKVPREDVSKRLFFLSFNVGLRFPPHFDFAKKKKKKIECQRKPSVQHDVSKG